MTSPPTSGFLARLLKTYAAQHLSVRLEFFDSGVAEHINAIQSHQLDIAFLTGLTDASGCETAFLWTEQIYFVLPAGSPLALRDKVKWSDLCLRTFVVSELWPGPEVQQFPVKHLSKIGQSPTIDIQPVCRDTLKLIVASCSRLTLVNEATIAIQFPDVVYRELEKKVIPFCVVWSPTNDNPASCRLLAMAQTMSKRTKDYNSAR
ncbi:LysR family substrate-binding domain-containing protein [Pseudochelatococcus sp. B33]